ncbi:hypothetical protein DFJ58DRAFT_728699 [Suillus subalutaceus]|uniref:uncharacterized protein n=1 Tax=Suillus subalutaceus TaxID=48586 RepID=UPI001B884017|nr:uncharacterized protein DFJ58DRAFT_728699 [Suillus subalutaceus]KAG1852150.1 hypothetical protein DFJ58DRAFT_728699 [Suillus subalutaceus]
MPVTSRRSRLRNLISERDGDKCVVTGTLNVHKGPYPSEDIEGYLEAAHILRRYIVHDHCGNNHIAGTINIIKHHTKLPEKIMDDLAGIIDNPENGMLLDITMYRRFNSYAWCLHPPCTGSIMFLWDHSQTGIELPDLRFIALHAAVAHVLHLSDPSEIIDKVYNAFFDKGFTVPSGNRASGEDFLIRLSLIGLMTNNHQLPRGGNTG